jgi:lipoate-protein ligase A
MTPIRLFLDPPARGSWNMAVDEALLASAASGTATLRFYEWSEPTLSLGYFQSAVQRHEHAASRDCPLVRRTTGGGAILHDQELTYSFCLPLTQPGNSPSAGTYRLFHQSLIGALASLGVPASLYESGPIAPPRDQGAFLCFLRRTQGDVMCCGSKVAGSAQRRHRGGLLQHGSVLLRRSVNAPELAGICDLAAVVISPEQLCQAWLGGLSRELPFEAARTMHQASEIGALAAQIERDRFGAAAWNLRR